MTCQWSWKHIAKLPDLVAMVWPVVWLLLPVFEGVPVLEFSQFAPFCGRARAPAGSARPLKQRQLDRFRVFFNMHRFGIGNVPLQKWKSTSWAQAVLLLVQSCFWAVERRLSPPVSETVGLFFCATCFSTNQPQGAFAAETNLMAKGQNGLHTTVLWREKTE